MDGVTMALVPSAVDSVSTGAGGMLVIAAANAGFSGWSETVWYAGFGRGCEQDARPSTKRRETIFFIFYSALKFSAHWCGLRAPGYMGDSRFWLVRASAPLLARGPAGRASEWWQVSRALARARRL